MFFIYSAYVYINTNFNPNLKHNGDDSKDWGYLATPTTIVNRTNCHDTVWIFQENPYIERIKAKVLDTGFLHVDPC